MSSVPQQSNCGPDRLTVKVSGSHTHTHSVGLFWTSDQPFTQTDTYTRNTRDGHPRPQRDSNPRSPQPSGRRSTPQTARPPASEYITFAGLIFVYFTYHSARLKLLMQKFLYIKWVCILSRNKVFRQLKNLPKFICGCTQ